MKNIYDLAKERRTFIKVTRFTLANALDALYADINVRNVWLSMEDGDFLVSFNYFQDYELKSRLMSSDSECCTAEEKK